MPTITFNGTPSGNEQAPVAIHNPDHVALLRSGKLTHWWSVTGMVEGLAEGSTLPVKFKSLLDTDRFSNSFKLSATKKPGLAFDDATGRYFLKMGYGEGRTRRTLALAALSAATPGSGYANGDTVTLQNGVVLTYTGNNGEFSTDANHAITNFGNFSAFPTTALTQVSTSGTGTGATFIPAFKSDCGALDLSPSAAIVPNESFIVAAVVRFPSPDDQPDSGGFIFGSQLNEAEIHNTIANSRYWGLRCGNGPVGPGAPIFVWKGDGNYISAAPALSDMRDNQWHVLIAIVPASGGANSVGLRIDGVLNNVKVGGNYSGLNTTTGNKSLRAGAAGRPAVGPTGGMLGDIAELIIAPYENGAMHQLEQALLDMYRPGLVST